MKPTVNSCPETFVTPHGVLALDLAAWNLDSLHDDQQTAETAGVLIKSFSRSVAPRSNLCPQRFDHTPGDFIWKNHRHGGG